MDDTQTIRVTFPSDALDHMRELNPLALNDPELARFYAGMGYIAAQQLSQSGVEIPGGAQAHLGEDDVESDDDV